MKKIKILYIGNNLTKKTKYGSPIFLLSKLLTTEGYDVTVSSNKLNKLLRFLDMFFTTIKKRNQIDYILIDTFSTYNFYYALVISQLARLFKVKYIPILHGGNLPHRIHNNQFLSNLIFKNSYINIAPSNYLYSFFKLKEYKVTHIPNIIELDLYQFKLRKIILPKLFWVRAFKEIYNPTLAIEVLKLLKKEYSNATLCMVGPFVDNSFLETKSLIKKYSLESSVEFTDTLTKEDWHHKSTEFDVFINTTNFDNMPVSVIEAMALGLPIISTNVGGLPFLIDNTVDGVLVEKNNAMEMYKAIKNLIVNYDEKMVLNAREKAESFSWQKNKTKWIQILK
ncbi:glycosyltransferase family 4 protein [Polaribacter sp. MSW13]|uniref:Glycosyltransferase family 4 protein n=1 Tax=Polaribacter marinus TaxID=2916838 RepID=A0A9X2AIB8_9FLAO|nr:glycosyltransferase family 4 protein [Polaribacter marinus]MCI2228401.1 glycosyltransferase family 4 protein [Polaribacter marinus]